MNTKNTTTVQHTQTGDIEQQCSPKHPLVLQNIENMNTYNTRIIEIIENSEEYLGDFYNESPNYTFNKEYVKKLIWLTYSDKEKKDRLDDELDEYFN